MKKTFGLLAFILILSGGIASAKPGSGYDPDEMSLKADELPKELERAGIKEKLGATIDKELKFRNEKGELITLGSLLSSDKPTILSLIYYSCPNLCNFHMNGLTDAIRGLKWSLGKEFNIVAISFDHNELPETAKAKKDSYLKAYGRLGAEKGWHFLTGDKENIAKITGQTGFEFRWEEKTKEWAHSSAAIMITPEGKISRYLHGVYFPEQDLRLALIEASQGKVGSIIDSFVMYCFKFDPRKNKYTIYAWNLMKAGASATVFLLAMALIPVWIRERKSSQKV